jgi:hypothetical protein
LRDTLREDQVPSMRCNEDRRPTEVAIDVGHHVVYAAVTGVIYELLD